MSTITGQREMKHFPAIQTTAGREPGGSGIFAFCTRGAGSLLRNVRRQEIFNRECHS